MRLLNVTTLEVERFDGPHVPPYAILSHVWGPEEVTMADMDTIARHRMRRQQELARILPRNPDKADTMKMLLISSMLMAFRGGHSSYPRDRPPTPPAIADLLPAALQAVGHSSYPRDRPPTPPSIADLLPAALQAVAHSSPDAYESSALVPASLHSSHALELKAGFAKISYACNQASRDGHQYLWVDTCCIDQTSSSAVTLALNSMFAWYRSAAVCYAYLADVHHTAPNPRGGYHSWKDAFAASRWFTRGWTLQELLAPRHLLFFGHGWKPLGSKAALSATISKATLIDRRTLLDPSLIPKASLARRMAWAARRTTTRPEDAAYALLGLFGVHLAPLYGEGLDAAFLRLQRKILARSDDQSLFAWGTITSASPNTQRHTHTADEVIGDDEDDALTGVLPFLARSPAAFEGMHRVVAAPPFRSPPPAAVPHAWTNKGVSIGLTLIRIGQGHHAAAQKYYLAPLACRHELEDPGDRLGVLLATTETPNVYVRTRTVTHTRVSGEELEETAAKDDRTVLVVSEHGGSGMWGREQEGEEEAVFVRAGDLVGPGYEVVEVKGKRAEWNREFGTLRVLGVGPADDGVGGKGVVYQLAVLVLFQRQLECGFCVRVLVDAADGEVFVDLVPPPVVPEEQKGVEDAVLNSLREQARRFWDAPGRFALEKAVAKGGKTMAVTRTVEVVNPETVGLEEEEEHHGGARVSGAGEGEVQSLRAAVLFVEKWETEYRRVVHATAERRKKGVIALEMSSMLYAGA